MKTLKEVVLNCKFCNKEFGYTEKNYNQRMREGKDPNYFFCRELCRNLHGGKTKECECKLCGKEFIRPISQTDSINVFCSHSCGITFNNRNKTKGYNRSKLEVYLEEKLSEIYPDLKIYYNNRDAINAELDFYIPSLCLAFELNGIFHYEPIFGQEKLNQTITNDKRKIQACLEHNIELCIIDSSKLKYFKESNAKPYLDIFCKIIDSKMVPPEEFESSLYSF